MLVTGEVVPTPGGLMPYKIVFKLDDTVLSEWPVRSTAEGEAQIAKALQSIGDVSEVRLIRRALSHARRKAAPSVR
jgi:hypothetical protein